VPTEAFLPSQILKIETLGHPHVVDRSVFFKTWDTRQLPEWVLNRKPRVPVIKHESESRRLAPVHRNWRLQPSSIRPQMHCRWATDRMWVQ
jgi:hypothetical protein